MPYISWMKQVPVHVTTYGTVASPNGRSGEWSLLSQIKWDKNEYSNMMSLKRFESKPMVKKILIYDQLNCWRHRQFIAIFYQFLHIRIEIIHGSHMYILFLPRVSLYVSFLTSRHKGLPVVKPIYAYGFHELFLN